MSKIAEFAGKVVLCSKFEKYGLETEFYTVNADGTVSFTNTIRNLAVRATQPQNVNYWSARKKGLFLTALRNQK